MCGALCSTGKSVRSVYRCRSGMTAGFHAKATGLGDFAVLTITGRSFLYHQILKMMGLVLAVAGMHSRTSKRM